jgi:hypothetical protein
MPQRDYTLVYTVQDGQAVPKLVAIAAGINSVHTAAKGATVDVMKLDQELRNLATSATISGQSLHTATQGVSGLSAQVGGMIPAWQVMEYGVALAQKFGEYINNARERLKELATEAQATRDTMRELANLQKHAGPDDQVVAQTIKQGIQAGMLPDDARQFMEQYEGSAPAGRTKGNIAPELESAVAVEGMKFGTRVNLQAKTAGDLTGVLSQYGKINSVEQAAGQLGSIAHGLNEGRGNLEPLTRSLIKTAGTIVEENGGPVGSLPELAAMLGVASTNATPDRAGTMLTNAVLGMRHFKDDAQGQTLKDLGVTPKMKFRDSLNLIAPKILAADKSGEGGDTWLRNHGWDNKQEITGILQLSRNLDVVDKRVKKAMGKGDGKTVMDDNEKFFSRERAGITRKIAARKAAQNFLLGQSREYSKMALDAGAQKMVEEHNKGGVRNSAREFAFDLGGILPAVGLEKTADYESKLRFMTMLEQEGKRVGVDVPGSFAKSGLGKAQMGGVDMITGASLNSAEKSQIYNTHRLRYKLFNDTKNLDRVIQAVMDAGGNPFGDDKNVNKGLDTISEEDVARRKRQAEHDDMPVNRKPPGAAAGAPGAGPTKGRPIGGPGPVTMGSPIIPGAARSGADTNRKLDALVALGKETNDILRGSGGSSSEGAGAVKPGRA